MRIPKRLSYSSIRLFEHDLEEFFLRYLADKAAPRFPQEKPAAAGSSFDAYIKSAISDALLGSKPQFEFQTIFEAQVEPQNRDFGIEAGKYIFECYKKCGAYEALLTLLKESVVEPRMEFSVDGIIGGAPFTGKPDLRFVLDRGSRIDCVYDFKVKGFCSKYPTSPSKGYAICRDAFDGKPSKNNGKEHPGYLDYEHHGLTINTVYMEACNDEYADQLSLYGWLLGEKPGDENVVLGIEELVAKPSKDPAERPTLRVASHRARVSSEYQLRLEARITDAWTRITTGHIFSDLTREESDEKCDILNDAAKTLSDDWFSDVTRNSFRH